MSLADRVRGLQLHGFGGACGDAAKRINREVFGGRGKYIIGANAKLLEDEGRFVGHVAVLYRGRLFDADGETDPETLRAWGMLDPHDSDYQLSEAEALEAALYEVSEDELDELFSGESC